MKISERFKSGPNRGTERGPDFGDFGSGTSARWLLFLSCLRSCTRPPPRENRIICECLLKSCQPMSTDKKPSQKSGLKLRSKGKNYEKEGEEKETIIISRQIKPSKFYLLFPVNFGFLALNRNRKKSPVARNFHVDKTS